jgi:hypothetical protein
MAPLPPPPPPLTLGAIVLVEFDELNELDGLRPNGQ